MATRFPRLRAAGRAFLRRLGASQQGITLVELMVVVGLMALAVSMVGAGLTQTLSLQRAWREDMAATQQLRHAGSWFGGDLMNAETSSLADGASSSVSYIITWKDTAGLTHTVAYSKAGDALVRIYDGVPLVIARRVSDVSFVRSGLVVTFTLTVEADPGVTRQTSWPVYLRRLSG